jgi:hypothetical protein
MKRKADFLKNGSLMIVGPAERKSHYLTRGKVRSTVQYRCFCDFTIENAFNLI